MADTPATPSEGDVITCESLVAQYSAALETIKELIDKPRKLLRSIQKLMDYPFDRVSAMLSDLTQAMKEALDSLMSNAKPIKKLISDLEAVLDCPILADTALGAQAAGLLDAIKKGAGIDKTIMNMVKQAVVNKIESQLNAYQSLVDNSISSLNKQYMDMLKETGISGYLKQLAQLEECLTNLCAAYASANAVFTKFKDTDIPGLLEDKLKVVYDPDTKSLKPLEDKTTKVVQKASDKMVEEYAEARKTLENFKNTVI